VLTLSSTNTVVYQSVELGPSVGDLRIVRSGLEPGVQIVVRSLQRVRPGMPVKPEQALAGNDDHRVAKR
jgi:multidrug efflux system membrane fusion protein